MAQYIYTMNRVAKMVPPKRFIIQDISLSFFPGAKIGVLGLNGSGKSTLLRIMEGVLAKPNDRQPKIRVACFEAWRYAREERPLIPLVRCIYESLKEDCSEQLGLSVFNFALGLSAGFKYSALGIEFCAKDVIDTVVGRSREDGDLPKADLAKNIEQIEDGAIAIHYNPLHTTMSKLLDQIKNAGIQINDLTTEESGLEDIFMQLTYDADR